MIPPKSELSHMAPVCNQDIADGLKTRTSKARLENKLISY